MYNLTNSSVPGAGTSLTTAYQLVASDLPNSQRVYFKFYLDVPSGKLVGTYANNILFYVNQSA
jgi:hypothetical protein